MDILAMEINNVTDLMVALKEALIVRDCEMVCKAEAAVKSWGLAVNEESVYIELIDQISISIYDLERLEE